MLGRQVAGIIVAASYNSNLRNEYAPALASGRPLTFIDSLPSGISADLTTTDHRNAARLGLAELLKTGARRIGIIAGRPEAPTTRERLAGCRDALRDAGIEWSDEYCRYGSFLAPFGEQAATELLNLRTHPDAFFILSEPHVPGAVKAVLAAGLRPGVDLRLGAFYDPTDRLDYIFPMTCVRQPARRLGQTAARLLLERLAATDQQAAGRMLPQRLVMLEAAVENSAEAFLNPASAELVRTD
jgi:LacI family transcriptional regulator